MKLFALFLALQAHAIPFEPKNGTLGFRATASPGSLAIRGTGELPTGKLELTEAPDGMFVEGTLKLKIASFKTGIALRDTHMKEKYLEAAKFPEALLILSKQKLAKQGRGPFTGVLLLHGVTHKVTGEAELTDGGKGVKASFPVKLTDHGITVPTFAGIAVADEVNVETELTL